MLLTSPFICYEISKHDDTNFHANWHKWCAGQQHEMVNFRVRRSRVKVTGG